MAKKRKESWKIMDNVFDEFTLNTVKKLITKGIIEGIKSPIMIGKEANVFTAVTKDMQVRIIKIYRLESCNFNKMYSYIISDPRFMDVKNQRRQVIFNWTKREFKNLSIARKSQVNCPMPIAFLNHVIVMELIGNLEPAKQLKNKYPIDIDKFFNELIKNLKKLYKNGEIVHADLSEFNILNHNDIPYLIDFSQSTSIKDHESINYLKRDIINLKRFFLKLNYEIDVDETIERIIH
ncbi:MAG: serine protein kinase RIO [Nanoarchaeota archaeon]